MKRETERIAAAFRAALIPSVAKKTPWDKVPGASQEAYVEATDAAIFNILLPLVKVAEDEITAPLREDITTLAEQLAACRIIVEKWCHYQGNAPELFEEYLAPIDAALAKARGEQP